MLPVSDDTRKCSGLSSPYIRVVEMIRLNKPVKLMEWGEGTNTLNQVWSEMGLGIIRTAKCKDGVTTIVVEAQGRVAKKNSNDDFVKVLQQGEGMTPRSLAWGEVAMGRLRTIEAAGGKTVLYIEVKVATKVGRT